MSFPRYPKYKDSGVEWLGEVPEEWRLLRTRFVLTLITSHSDEAADHVVALENIESWSARFIDTETEFTGEGVRFRKGDLLFGKLRPYLAKILVGERDGNAVGDFHVLRPSEGNSADFLKFLFLTPAFISLLDGSTVGAKMPRVGWPFLADVWMPVPSIEEQQQIATFLNNETSKIDALIGEQRRLIELLKEKRQAVISQAVTKGLHDSVGWRESGVEWIGVTPASWTLIPLGRITVSSCDGPFGSGLKSDHYVQEGIRVIRLQNIRNGEFSGDDAAFIDSEHYKTLGDHDVRPGDLLIAGLGDENNLVGRACVAPNDVGPAMVKADCFRFRLGSIAVPSFIAWQLTIGAAADGRLANGSTRSRISLSRMADRVIALPPIEEQREIADKLRSLEVKYKALRDSAERMVRVLQERRSALVSAAVTGRVDVRQPLKKPVASVKAYNSGFAHQLLAATILEQCNDKHMGRVKLQKLIHVTEYHARIEDLKGEYTRQMAGPLDMKAIAGLERGLEKQHWYKTVREGQRYRYQPLERKGQHQKYLEQWADKQDRIEEVLTLMGGMNMRQCEIVSTLYAAWNDLLIDGLPATDDVILDQAATAEGWHESKERTPRDKWVSALQWMRQHALIPTGFGSHTRRASPESIHEPA